MPSALRGELRVPAGRQRDMSGPEIALAGIAGAS